MLKGDFNKVTCNFIEIKLRHGCSPVNLLHIFRAPFLKKTFVWLLLNVSSKRNQNNFNKISGMGKLIFKQIADLLEHLLWLERLIFRVSFS